MLPAAPGRFSTTTGFAQRSLSFWEIKRALMSAPPPGVKPTSRRTGFAGYCRPKAVAAASAHASASASLMAVDALRGDDIGPQRVEVFLLQKIAPGRHLVLAARHRSHEALALIVREFAQVEGALWIQHARAVARGAI